MTRKNLEHIQKGQKRNCDTNKQKQNREEGGGGTGREVAGGGGGGGRGVEEEEACQRKRHRVSIPRELIRAEFMSRLSSANYLPLVCCFSSSAFYSASFCFKKKKKKAGGRGEKKQHKKKHDDLKWRGRSSKPKYRLEMKEKLDNKKANVTRMLKNLQQTKKKKKKNLKERERERETEAETDREREKQTWRTLHFPFCLFLKSFISIASYFISWKLCITFSVWLYFYF